MFQEAGMGEDGPELDDDGVDGFRIDGIDTTTGAGEPTSESCGILCMIAMFVGSATLI
jgi:hypothetical protein